MTTHEKGNAPAIAATTTRAPEVLIKGYSHDTAPAEKKKRRRLPLHLIVREEETHRIALCGHRIPRKHAITAATSPSSEYHFYPCEPCHALAAYEQELADEGGNQR